MTDGAHRPLEAPKLGHLALQQPAPEVLLHARRVPAGEQQPCVCACVAGERREYSRMRSTTTRARVHTHAHANTHTHTRTHAHTRMRAHKRARARTVVRIGHDIGPRDRGPEPRVVLEFCHVTSRMRLS
jgi:hypothetical protein